MKRHTEVNRLRKVKGTFALRSWPCFFKVEGDERCFYSLIEKEWFLNGVWIFIDQIFNPNAILNHF